jgi:uncharacterized protein
LSPLFNEQIQVIVRTDARWDYLHELRGLRLGIGRADGARARTARTLYHQLFGEALPASSVNELGEAQALQQLIEGKALDAVVLVTEQPVLQQLPAAQRRKLRELSANPNDRRTAALLQTYPNLRLTASDMARPTVTNYLVAADPVAPANAGALRTLASALCRAQPSLQAQGSPLLRGLSASQQPSVGWPYLVPRNGSGGCPAAEPALAETRPDYKG